jgi:serine/threonine protein kinase
MKTATITKLPEDFIENEKKGKAEKKTGRRIGYNYIILKSLKESKKNDVIKCLYIKSFTNFGLCVIKEGSQGDTKDKHGRDIIDRLKWQNKLHQYLQDKIRMPRLLGNFEENGNYYLVIEHIKGKALQKLCTENKKELRQSIISGGKLGVRFLEYLIQIAGILEAIHAQQIVHRDATPNNYMVMPNGKVALIDMELCYSMEKQFPSPAFGIGTYGYMSRQQEAIMTPTKSEDIFALGAIIFQIWSGISPGKLGSESAKDLTTKIHFFIPDQQIANIVKRCLIPEDDQLKASEIKQILQQYKTDLKNKKNRKIHQSTPITHEEIESTIRNAVITLSTPLLVEEDKGWFSDDMKEPAEEDKHKLRKQWYASYNRGVSGIIYFLSKAMQAGINVDITLPYIHKGIELVKQRYIDRIQHASAGLHYGSDGIAAVLASALKGDLLEPSSEHFEWIDLLLQKSCLSGNFINGVAGQGLANLVCKSFVSPNNLIERLNRYADLLISKQDQEGYWVNGYYRQKYFNRKRKRVNRGFADGMAGIIYFLLEYGHLYKHEASIDAAHRGLQWLIRKAKHRNNTVRWLSAKNKELSYGWADGIAGIALTFIKAYEHTGKDVYKNYAENALRGIPENLTDNNLSQLRGLSGLGEVYLEAYRVFKNSSWLQRAEWITEVIMKMKKQHTKYGAYWLVESERKPVANFMIGNTGILHFLLRFCHPEKIGFPLISATDN